MAAAQGGQAVPSGPSQASEAQPSTQTQPQQQYPGDPITKAKIYMNQLKENLAVRIC